MNLKFLSLLTIFSVAIFAEQEYTWQKSDTSEKKDTIYYINYKRSDYNQTQNTYRTFSKTDLQKDYELQRKKEKSLVRR